MPYYDNWEILMWTYVDGVKAMSQLEWKSVGSGQVYNITPNAC